MFQDGDRLSFAASALYNQKNAVYFQPDTFYIWVPLKYPKDTDFE